MNKTILIASDHAGFDLKTYIIEHCKGYDWEDLGPHDSERVDYPDYANKVAEQVNQDFSVRGVLVCGSGQGMVMRANKFPMVRAALCWSEEVAELSRAHNDANVLCLGSRLLSPELAVKIVERFLKSEFEGGRHQARVEKINLDTCES